MKCNKHPSYKGYRRPTADCQECREIYEQNKTQIKNLMKLSELSESEQLKISKLDDQMLLIEFPFKKYGFNRGQLRELKKLAKEKFSNAPVTPESVGKDIALVKTKNQKSQTEKKNKILIEQVATLEKEKEAILRFPEQSISHEITPLGNSNSSEATAVVVFSDWHVEERVTPSSVNDLNKYDVSIARKRADEAFQIALKLRNLENSNNSVPNMVVALLGDFITGNIHEENLSICTLDPIDAAIEARNMLKSGFDFLLKNSDLKQIIVPCHAGNHSRITKKPRSSETEMGNSLELFMYSFLAQEYKDEPRIKFLISRSYTSRLQVYDTVLRFHHGHRIRFQGGIGGLAVPASKYVLRANTAWNADYDVFGHHHQKQKGSRFICNGSLIGYNAYAQDSAFEFEQPSQTYFLINKRWKDIIDWRPILFSN